jgi:hypothetical protein
MRFPGKAALAFLLLATPPLPLSNGFVLAKPPVTSSTCGLGSYINVSGHCVPRPRRSPTVPAGATARCRDGTYSFSEHRRGTCSYHGGVAEWL